MGSKTKRHAARKKRAHKAAAQPLNFDVHGRKVFEALVGRQALASEFDADPEVARTQLDAEYENLVGSLSAGVSPFNVHRLIEVGRMAWLPWSWSGMHVIDTSAGAAFLELIAMVAAVSAGTTAEGSTELEPNAMSHFISGAHLTIERLISITTLRDLLAFDPADKFAQVRQMVKSAQALIRNTSYAEMTEATLVELFDADPMTRQAVIEAVGFTAAEALVVLRACDQLQVARLNERANEFREGAATAIPEMGGVASEANMAAVVEATMAFFEPAEEAVTVSASEVSDTIGLGVDVVQAVFSRFVLDVAGMSVKEVVDAFLSGRSPARTRPLMRTPSGRVMLVHPVLAVDAVKSNLEEALKAGPNWNQYSDHRGHLLEARTTTAIKSMWPAVTEHAGIEYFLPLDEAEEAAGDPSNYTYLVEGDHLFVVDDVALIVEDKAGSFSERARGGHSGRLQTDLANLITKAADQAGRMKKAILRDGGLRTRDSEWLDLSEVREIHTIAVSLDDLSGVSTATAALVEAGVLRADHIPWTVSIHDLDLIARLIERPADLLLYIRRRTNPLVTALYMAADELDLFLYFCDTGLWVEPDPDEVVAAFPWLGSVATADRRRYRKQIPGFITSHTDPLDVWFYGQTGANGEQPAKPTRWRSPLDELVDQLAARRTFGWLSIGATLLEGDTATQRKFAAIPKELLSHPSHNGRGRSYTVPVVGTAVPDESWLLVWATRPATIGLESEVERLTSYARAKKYQLGLRRAAVFIYGEDTGSLEAVAYASDTGALPVELKPVLAGLRPAAEMTHWRPPGAKRPRKVAPKQLPKQ